jgi:hypothetical protein
MTTISDYPAQPRPRNPATEPDRGTFRRRLETFFCVTAAGLTALNLMAAFYLLQAVGEARSLDARLADMAGLEKRLKANLDLVNQGLQTRLENLDRDMHYRVSELSEAVGNVQKLSMPREKEAVAFALAAPPLTTEAALAPAENAVDAGEEAAPVEPIQRPKKPKRAAPVSTVATSYQRIESPDGKVTYRRVQ